LHLQLCEKTGEASRTTFLSTESPLIILCIISQALYPTSNNGRFTEVSSGIKLRAL